MLASQGAFSSVREHRNQTQQRIQIETAERPGVIAHPEVSFGKHGLHGQRQAHSQRGGDQSRHRQTSVEPDDARNRSYKFKHRTEKLPAQSRQQPYAMDAMTALRHIGGQAAMKVSVPELGNFFEKRHTQTRLEMSADA